MNKYLYPIKKLNIKSWIKYWLLKVKASEFAYKVSEIFSGTFITINNTIRKEFIKFLLFGNSIQDGEPTPDNEVPINSCGDNVNLFDKEAIENVRLDENGTTSSSTSMVTTDFIPININKTYYKTITGSALVKLFDENKDVIVSTGWDIANFGNAQSFSIPVAFQNAKYIRFSITNEYVDTFKLEEGSQATPYSPYNQGVITEKIVNKNFLKIKSGTYKDNSQELTVIVNEDGSIRVQANTTTYRQLYIPLEKDLILQPNDYNWNAIPTGILPNYTTSLRILTTNVAIDANSFANTFLSITRDTKTSKNATITQRKMFKYFFIYVAGNTAVDCNIETQLELGSIATDYVEHKEQTYPIYTQQPMRSIGTTRDVFVKKSDGKWYERHWIKEVILNGSEDSWSRQGTNTSGNYRFRITLGDNLVAPNASTLVPVLCNKLKAITAVDSYYNIQGIAIDSSANHYAFIVITDIETTTLAGFKEYLSSNNILVDYILTEPTDLLCTEEQTEQLESLLQAKSYNGQTNIYSEDIVSPYLEIQGYVKESD